MQSTRMTLGLPTHSHAHRDNVLRNEGSIPRDICPIEQWCQSNGSNVIPRLAGPGLAGLRPHWGSRGAMPRRHLCMMSIDPVFLRRVTARNRTKGSNGSNAHPKAGSSWPMSYP